MITSWIKETHIKGFMKTDIRTRSIHSRYRHNVLTRNVFLNRVHLPDEEGRGGGGEADGWLATLCSQDGFLQSPLYLSIPSAIKDSCVNLHSQAPLLPIHLLTLSILQLQNKKEGTP